ncbi:CLUMA_CG009401, isoform A [Clunio marinus]|uniref:CLUMA_CG009401, isoform A n=1 Tax=Clunio marinus TaxID=568069 RepID=A0A1J1I6N9_9DIPT|nr:CLUMA_CG009401, isoform A [Clunio marinus]
MKQKRPNLKSKIYEKLNSEDVKSFWRFFGEFITKSSIHGVKYICDSSLHPFERVFWFIILLLTCWGAYKIGMTQYSRFAANPTVISLEKDYRQWNGTLPSLTVCYHNRINESKAQDLIKRLWGYEQDDEEYSYFFNYIQAVVNVNESFSKFNRFANDKRLEYINMLTIAKEVHPLINSIVSSYDTLVEFKMNEIITEKGICYNVNSIAWHMISTLYIAIHSPLEIPSDKTPFFSIGMTDEIESTYNMLETMFNKRRSSDALRTLNVIQRKCIFNDESIEQLLIYSYGGLIICLITCSLVCRAKEALRLCGCRPYFYPFVNGTSCSPAGLLCLDVKKWRNRIVSCACPKTCVEIVYTQNSLKKINWAADGGIPFTQKSSFRYEILAPRARLRRDVLFSLDDLIVSFGAVGALFLGYNFRDQAVMIYFLIKSVIEFVYIRCIKQ